MTRSVLWIVPVAIALAVIAVLAALQMSSREVAPARITWNISVWGPPRAVTRGIEAAKRMLEDTGAGSFEWKIYYGSTLSPEKEGLDSIKIGAVEGAMTARAITRASCPWPPCWSSRSC